MSLKVLLIEDNREMRTMIQVALETLDYHVIPCSDAEVAFHIIESDTPPQLLITDVNLPGVSGFEIVRYIRQQGLDIAVFIMTADQVASHQPEIEMADIFLMKPFDIRQLLHFVSRLMANHDARSA